MRASSLTAASWSPDGEHLTSAEVAPVTIESRSEEDADKRSQTPVQKEVARIAEMQRVAFAASGGPRPRVVPR